MLPIKLKNIKQMDLNDLIGLTIEHVETNDTVTRLQLSSNGVDSYLLQVDADGKITFAEEETLDILNPLKAALESLNEHMVDCACYYIQNSVIYFRDETELDEDLKLCSIYEIDSFTMSDDRVTINFCYVDKLPLNLLVDGPEY